jgi:hypothetical protein
MPAHHVIDMTNRVVLTVFTGVLTLHDVADNRKKLRAETSFDPRFSELIDFSAVSEIELDINELRALFKRDPFSIISKRALVVGLPSSIHGAAQMYRLMRDNKLCVGIFHTIAEALRWLRGSKSAP